MASVFAKLNFIEKPQPKKGSEEIKEVRLRKTQTIVTIIVTSIVTIIVHGNPNSYSL